MVGTLVSALIFLALTIDSHRQIPALTNAAAIDATVVAGKDVWHRNNCINCHTLLGEGAYYAPDLTQITTQRGAAVPARVPEGSVALLLRGARSAGSCPP